MDKALLYLSSEMIQAVYKLVKNILLFSLDEEEQQGWQEVIKCNVVQGFLLIIS